MMPDLSSGKPHKSFGVFDFLQRLSAAIILVLITFNPSGYYYTHRDCYQPQPGNFWYPATIRSFTR